MINYFLTFLKPPACSLQTLVLLTQTNDLKKAQKVDDLYVQIIYTH